jgi:hypothetical protein
VYCLAGQVNGGDGSGGEDARKEEKDVIEGKREEK